jgi:hypothetical protein
MCNESFHDIGESLVRTLGVYDDCIFSYVVNVKVLHWRDFDLIRIHNGGLGEIEACGC